jgi:hypothetical protein
MNDFLENLRTQAWRTHSARNAAARRLKRRELFSTVSLAFFSAISVAIAFLQRIYVTAGSAEDNFVTGLSGVLGIFLLAISLMEWGAGNGAKAEALYRNAEELNAFQRGVALRLAQLSSGVNVTWAEVTELQREYEAVKGRCSVNHDPIDDRYFIATRRKAPEFLAADGTPRMDGPAAFWATVIWHLSSVWYFAVFWLVIVAALVRVCVMHGAG